MHRTPRLRLSRIFRPWALDRRALLRIGASGALAAAVSTATWGWALAAPTTKGTPLSVSAAAETAEIREFAYQPPAIEVAVGTTITWTNQDAVEHSVTASDGSFDSGLFLQAGTYAHAFDAPGTYAYICTQHGWMTGQVTVTP